MSVENFLRGSDDPADVDAARSELKDARLALLKRRAGLLQNRINNAIDQAGQFRVQLGETTAEIARLETPIPSSAIIAERGKHGEA